MVANFIPLIMQGASDTMGILNKLFGGGGSSYNSDSARVAKWQHNYNLATMKQAQKYTLDQMAKSYNYNARGVALQNKYNVQNMGKQYNYNLALQKQAQGFETNMYKQRYQMQVEDLMKAGINPLYGLGTAPTLASSGSSVGLPNSGAPTASGGMSPLGSGMADLASEMNNKRLYRLEKQKTQMSILNSVYNNSALKAQAEKMRQETKTEEMKTGLTLLQKIGQIKDNLLKQKDIDNYDKKLAKELEEAGSRITLNLASAGNQNAQASNARASADNTRTQTQLMKDAQSAGADINATEEKIYEKYPWLKGIVAGSQVGGKIIGNLTGGGGINVNTSTTTNNHQHTTNNTTHNHNKGQKTYIKSKKVHK